MPRPLDATWAGADDANEQHGDEQAGDMANKNELTETELDNFIGFMTFIAKNSLWEEAKAALLAEGITTIKVSTEPIRVIRKLINEGLLTSDRLDEAGRRHALVIAECGCGVSSPGPPGHGPVVPTSPGSDGGTDAGTPTTVPADGG
jgi:hypothetical protein